MRILFIMCIFAVSYAQKDIEFALSQIRSTLNCSEGPITYGLPEENSKYSHEVVLPIASRESVCFRLVNNGLAIGSNKMKLVPNYFSSTVHSIRFYQLEQIYPVIESYEFGVPEVSTNCKCTCNAICSQTQTESQCAERNENKNKQTSCCQFYFSNNNTLGCLPDESPGICCQVRVSPYGNESYTAVKLGEPTTFATIIYEAHAYNNEKWELKDESVLRTQLFTGEKDQFLDLADHITLSVPSEALKNNRLETGIYFGKTEPGGNVYDIRMESLNGITEFDFDRFGWYRRSEDGEFYIKNTMNDLLKATVTNCEQKIFENIIEADYYMPIWSNFSKPMKLLHPWIKSAFILKTNQLIVTPVDEKHMLINIELHESISIHGSTLKYLLGAIDRVSSALDSEIQSIWETVTTSLENGTSYLIKCVQELVDIFIIVSILITCVVLIKYITIPLIQCYFFPGKMFLPTQLLRRSPRTQIEFENETYLLPTTDQH